MREVRHGDVFLIPYSDNIAYNIDFHSTISKRVEVIVVKHQSWHCEE